MCKNHFLAIALGVLLAVSSYAQTNQNQTDEGEAGFFFGVGMSSGIFTSDKLAVYSDFDILKLNAGRIGAYYELPMGAGNFFAGLEVGYASGSSFGGGGGVDFVPINLNATYAFNIADILFIGPGVKVGGMGLLGDTKYNILPLVGAVLDLELRIPSFPLGIYAMGGVNAYPTSHSFNTLPTVEAGLRFPRGTLGSGQSSQPRERTQSTATAPASAAPNQGAGTSTGTAAATTPPAAAATPPAAAATPPAAATTPPATQARPSALTPTANSRLITLENGRQGLFSSVYFEPDTGILIERYRPILEEAGRLLASNPNLRLLLRTYTAPFGTPEGRQMVSMERGQFCRDFFMQNYGVAASRITIEPYGSEREPLNIRTDDWVSYRCAEIIITE